MSRGWIPILRDLLALGKEVQQKTQRVCPNVNCPLRQNRPATEPVATQDEMIRRQKELFKRNHPNG